MKPRPLSAIILCTALLAYVLSVGPVVRSSMRRGLLDDPNLIIYEPLIFAAKHSRSIDRTLNWYIRLWLTPEG
jgi:hypothetical protein